MHSFDVSLNAHDADIFCSFVHICENLGLLQLLELPETITIARSGMCHVLIGFQHFLCKIFQVVQLRQIVYMVDNA
jgi:hypothetical protein